MDKQRNLSFSLLTVPCERALQLKFNREKQEVLPQDATETGINIHKAIQGCIDNLNFEPLEEFLEIKGDPVSIWQKYKDYEHKSEEYIKYDIDGYTIIGKLDRVINMDNKVILIDHKTSYDATITEHHKKQMMYYSLPYLQKDKEVFTFIYFVRWSLLMPCGNYSSFESYDNITKQIRIDISRTKQIMSMPNPSAEPCSYCKWCDYIVSCPGKPSKLPTNDLEAEHIAGEYIKCQEKYKQIEKLVKAWCGKNGNIKYKDKIVGYFDSKKYEVDSEIIDFAEKQGLVLNDIANLSTQKIKRLGKTNEEFLNFININIVPKFTVKNAK